jgi:arginyl-tRNA synthetase
MEKDIANCVSEALLTLYGSTPGTEAISIQKTGSDFRHESDRTVMVFPLVKISRKAPEQTATEIGEFLKEKLDYIESYKAIKGFLNLRIRNEFWSATLNDELQTAAAAEDNAAPLLIEFSSPNTNKPLHLGHIRNNLLGESISRILSAAGKKVIRVNLVNDRGIHICKSMLAWQKWGQGETPETSGLKGDKLAGKYYVRFETENRSILSELKANGSTLV